MQDRMTIWKSPSVSVGMVGLLGIASFLIDIAHILLWMRVAFAGVLFVLPGGFIFSLIPVRDSWNIIDFAGYGFAISLVLMGILGLLARTLHWTFDLIEIFWYGLIILGLIAFSLKMKNRSARLAKFSASSKALLAIILVQVLLFAYSGVFVINLDQHTYNAEVTNFLREEPLDWLEIYYDTGNLISDRFYLSYWTLAQSLMVDISGVHILQAQLMINGLMVLLTTVAIYIFARNLGHDPKMALIIVLLSLLCYSVLTQNGRQAGAQFFRRPIQDKLVAGFVLAPITISTAYICAVSRRRFAYIGFALSFLSMMFAHVMMAGFVLVAIGIWCLVRLVLDKQGRLNAIVIGLIAAVIFSPAVLLRLNTDTSIYNYGDETVSARQKVLVDEESGFYIIHPNVAGTLTYTLLLLVSAAIVLRARMRKPFNNESMLMLALALTAGIGLIPYTAWIYGRLVSIPHIIRVLWLLPYGYMLSFVLQTGWDILCSYNPRIRDKTRWLQQDKVVIPFLSLTILVTVILLNVQRSVDFSRDIVSAFEREEELLEVAEYIESKHDERVWVLGSPDYRNVIPSISSKAITLSHFNSLRMILHSGISQEQAAMQIDDNLHFFNSYVSLEEKLSIIDKYDIDYLLFDPKYSHMMDMLFDFEAGRFELVYAQDSVKLVKIN